MLGLVVGGNADWFSQTFAQEGRSELAVAGHLHVLVGEDDPYVALVAVDSSVGVLDAVVGRCLHVFGNPLLHAELRDHAHRLLDLLTRHDRDGLGRRPVHERGFQHLLDLGRREVAAGFAHNRDHLRLGLASLFALQYRHGFEPGAGQGLLEVRGRVEAHDQVVQDDLGELGRVEDQVGAGKGLQIEQEGKPGHSRGVRVRVEGGHDGVLVRVLDDELLERDAFLGRLEREHEVRHRAGHHLDLLALQALEVLADPGDAAVVAVGIVANGDGLRLDAAVSRSQQGVHVGQGDRRVLVAQEGVDGLAVVREHAEVDADLVLVRPFLADARRLAVLPERPADVVGLGESALVPAVRREIAPGGARALCGRHRCRLQLGSERRQRQAQQGHAHRCDGEELLHLGSPFLATPGRGG